MDSGRAAAGIPRDVSPLDEAAISPRLLHSDSNDSLPHLAISKPTRSLSAITQPGDLSSRIAITFAKLPVEVIEL
jgi:hypothetical protein